MNTTTSAKPKAKFSSRNLSAVFKAPLRTKPLADNATGPLQRPNSRMLVLGRAAVAPPAPLNTPSLKRESQVLDVHVSLVPASSNWAENTEKEQKPEDDEALKNAPAADVVVPPLTPEDVWTPESVAEHLHTTSVSVCPKVMVESSGRWGDDAVEDDIVQNNIRRQRQKEKEFPDLKEAAEEAQIQYSQGYEHTDDTSSLMGTHQLEKHHGRATGRWAHFNEQQTQRSMQEGRWSRDHYGQSEDDRWPRDRYGRDEDRWAHDRYTLDDSDHWSRGHSSRRDDGYERERRPIKSSNIEVLPVPNDTPTHFSRSDARFDMVAYGDRDRIVGHSPHRMDWNRRGRRDEQPTSSSPQHEEDSLFHTPQQKRPVVQSPVSPAPRASPMKAGATPAKAMNWHSLSSSAHGSGTTWGDSGGTVDAWSKDEQPTTNVAEAAESSTESSSNSSVSCSCSPLQQVHLLKRPKMLFDPKTGGMVNAEDKTGSGELQVNKLSRDRGQDRENRKLSTAKASAHASKKNEKPEANRTGKARPINTVNMEDVPDSAVLDDASTSSAIAVDSMEEVDVEETSDTSDASFSVSSNAVFTAKNVKREADVSSIRGRKAYCDHNYVPVKSVQKETQAIRDYRRTTGTQQDRQCLDFATNACSRTNCSKVTEHVKRNSSTRSDRCDTGSNKPTQRRYSKKVGVASSKQSNVELTLVKQIAEGSNGGVVVLSNEQEGVEVSLEDDGFETVKSVRVGFSEKKLLRKRLVSTEASAQEANEKNVAYALAEEHADHQPNEQSKGEAVQENFSTAFKMVDTQPVTTSRGKVATLRRNRDSAEQTTKEKKMKLKRKKQSVRTSGPKTKQYKHVPAKITAESGKSGEVKQLITPAKPTEQVAGEAPVESPVSKKRSQYVKMVTRTESNQEQKPQNEKRVQGNSTRRSNDRKASISSAAGPRRMQTQSKRQGAERTAGSADRVVQKVSTVKPRDPVANARPKQARQVYVVKTPAPSAVTSGATSTAA